MLVNIILVVTKFLFIVPISAKLVIGGALFKSAVKLAIATGHDMQMFNDLHNCIIQISLVHLKELLKLDIN